MKNFWSVIVYSMENKGFVTEAPLFEGTWKRNRPPVSSDQVHRLRLVEELEKRREWPLTLISAPRRRKGTRTTG